jgi:kynureninase
MITLTSPTSPEDNVFTTAEILSAISTHGPTTALLLLPGIQYYTGQLLDIPTITAHAHKHGIFVIFDLAHAVGNVPLALHDWDVDAAAWCSYKYLNGGPGCIGGLFVHARHGDAVVGQQPRADPATAAAADDGNRHHRPEEEEEEGGGHYAYTNRLAGWRANDKRTRFAMATTPGFRPVRGAAGFQLSNPSILDMTSLGASLEVFALAGGVGRLREKSVRLTGFLEELLLLLSGGSMAAEERALFRIITPSDPQQRGAQLSLKLAEGLLETVMRELERRAVIVDERKPDVIRVAPAPLYNRFEDCVAFVEAFAEALAVARQARA